MYPRIYHRLLSYCVLKTKCRRSLRYSITGASCPINSIARRLSTSSLLQSPAKTTTMDLEAKDFGDVHFEGGGDHNADVFKEVPDEFDEDDQSMEVDIEAITNNDPEKMEALRTVLHDMHSIRAKGSPFVPTKISPRRWEMLLQCQTHHERRSLLKHLFLMERRDQTEKKKKTESLLRHEQSVPKVPRPQHTTSSPSEYKLSRNSLFYRQSNSTIAAYFNYRLAMAEWFGSSLIIDCGYESYMNMRELHHCCTQLVLSWVHNRNNPDPFNIVFCNTNESSEVYKHFARFMPSVITDENPINFTEKHYSDLFPAEKLIYLSPHSEHEMTEYEPDSVYIIGAFVDEAVHDPVSMERAGRDGVRTAKFPLDRYLNWCQGSQLLPINQCVSIMNDLKNGVSWDEALRCIARRKLNYVGLNFKKEPKVDLKSLRHMWAIYSYEMGKEPKRRAPCDV